MIRNRNKWPQAISAFAIGLGAGAAIGILFAPQSGEDTRNSLSDAAQDRVDEAVARGKTLLRRARRNFGEAREFVNDVAGTAEGAFHEVRKAVSS